MHEADCLKKIPLYTIKNKQLLKGTLDAVRTQTVELWVVEMPNPSKIRTIRQPLKRFIESQLEAPRYFRTGFFDIPRELDFEIGNENVAR